MTKWTLGRLAAALVALALTAPAAASARTIRVTTASDEFGGSHKCGLREAVQAANTDGAFGGCRAGRGRDKLKLAAKTYVLNRNGSNGDLFDADNSTTDLDISAPLSIVGKQARRTKIDSGRRFAILDSSAGRLALSKLTIQNGKSDFGGGINVTQKLVLNKVTVKGNEAKFGSGVDLGVGATAAVRRSRIEQNVSTAATAGIASGAGLQLVKTKVLRNRGAQSGGLVATGPTVVKGSTFKGNRGDPSLAGGGLSGAILSWASLKVTDSKLIGNRGRAGGALLVTNNGNLVGNAKVVRTTIANNTAVAGADGAGLGGGIGLHDGGGLNLIDSTISGNAAEFGGGIHIRDADPVVITNSTISGNRATAFGGGIATDNNAGERVALRSVTVAANRADTDSDGFGDGGGIASDVTSLQSTIIADNSDASGGAPDCVGTYSSFGHNLIEAVAGCKVTGSTGTNITGEDPGLGKLADNGGKTKTHALSRSSPAINTGGGCPDRDQRGKKRARCDIGAYERR